MNIKTLKLILVMLMPVMLNAQNRTDEKGLKQGPWETKYENGKIRYSGVFKDGKPIGEFKRFYETGELKILQVFDNKGNSKAIIYYDNGEVAAKGNYVGSKKDSVWSYYSYYEKALRMTESYQLGVREGKTIRYFNNGKMSDELEWHNDQMHGKWTQYFENGQISLQTRHINGTREGAFKTFYSNGVLETAGFYKKGLPEGTWYYYDENGNEKTHIEYVAGIAKNQDQLTAKEQEYLNKLEQNKGRIPEPSEEDLMPR
jgi:antitoxin component YwqK of YwqJK toxin-antitoxin module